MGDIEGRSGRSSDIYPINRFESSNWGSGDRSDTYTHTYTYAPFRVPPRGRPYRYQRKLHYVYIPNAECWSVMFNYRGWYWRVGMCLEEEKRGTAAGGREGRGGRDWFRLLVRKVTPFSVRIRAEEKRRRRSGTVERNGQQYCRRGPGICVGRIGRGWQGPPEWHGKLIIRFWKSWPPIEYPKQTAPFAIPRASFRRAASRRSLIFRWWESASFLFLWAFRRATGIDMSETSFEMSTFVWNYIMSWNQKDHEIQFRTKFWWRRTARKREREKRESFEMSNNVYCALISQT